MLTAAGILLACWLLVPLAFLVGAAVGIASEERWHHARHVCARRHGRSHLGVVAGRWSA